MIDTHAHIYYDDLYVNIEEVLKECDERGIKKIYMPNVDHSSIEHMLELEERFPGKCISMMGLHPCSVKEDFEKELNIVEEYLKKRKFAAIGEIGIDHYWTRDFDTQQVIAFNYQMDLAAQYELPVAIHSRDSIDTIISILKNRPENTFRGVLHCFTGNADQAKELTDMGLFLGIGGVVTFKNSGLDKTLTEVDLKHIVLETDSPYLAPVPFRGKPNSPVYLTIIAEKIAEIKKVSVEEVAQITTRNSEVLFK